MLSPERPNSALRTRERRLVNDWNYTNRSPARCMSQQVVGDEAQLYNNSTTIPQSPSIPQQQHDHDRRQDSQDVLEEAPSWRDDCRFVVDCSPSCALSLICLWSCGKNWAGVSEVLHNKMIISNINHGNMRLQLIRVTNKYSSQTRLGRIVG